MPMAIYATATRPIARTHKRRPDLPTCVAYRIALERRAPRPPAHLLLNDSSCPREHNTPLPLERSPPASFKRMLGGGRCLLAPHADDDRYHQHFHEPVAGMDRGHLPRDVLPEDRSREKDHREPDPQEEAKVDGAHPAADAE